MEPEERGATLELRLMLASLALAAAVFALFLWQISTGGATDPPPGVIGYRADEGDGWVTAAGDVAPAPSVVPAAAAAQANAPEDTLFAYVENVGGVSKLMVAEDGSVHELATLSGPGSPPLVHGGKTEARSADGVPLVLKWSPDGRTLAWGSVAEAPYVLGLATRGDWQTRELPLEGGYVGELEWSPDSRYLAISTYAENRTDHTVLVLDTDSTDPVKRLAKGCVTVWSPDSQYLALHGEPASQPGLWVVSVDGDATQVIDRLGVVPFAWVPD